MSDEAVSTAYDAGSVEPRLYETWVERGYFSPRPGGEPYSIVLPPPNVTGALHIGHALDHTMQDVLIRRRRMQGYETLWLPGTDHAGIGTEVLVTRQLREEGIEKRDIGREAFIDRVWEWKERYGDTIVQQMKALGSSCDWSRLRFTMDEGLQQAVRVAFVRMYDDGLIYRGERIINWCPTDHTALSDSEVEHEDVDGELIHIRYPLEDGGEIVVATTRVETMLGDTGIAVHPDDERYRQMVGRMATLPLVGRSLPIVADEAVDPEFGTGVVKVTPAHDPNDFEIGERHGLDVINVFDEDARVNDEAPEAFRGLDRYEARRAVLEALKAEGVVQHEERPFRHAVGHCYRCKSEIEPWLSGKQWFVAVERLKGPAKEAALDGRVSFFPPRWQRSYTTWLDNLRDWNISRQLWWGHRIPVWYCSNGHELASIEDPTACRECGAGVEQDPDVLDTWFSSQLWPFSTLGWPDETPDLERFYPTSVLVTGYEILYLWVARMIMSGLYLLDDVPFAHTVIHGLVRDEHNRKMSKSLGNVINPLDLIGRYGADALRFSLMRQASPEQQNLPLGERDIESAQHFANKIWNAARLVLGEYAGGVPELPPRERLGVVARWLLSAHQACVDEVDSAIEEYRFSDAAQALYRFTWSEYCDWGLEMAKHLLYEGSEQERTDMASVLAWVLERTLRLLHPIMPFVTEEVWQRFGAGESIVIAEWPSGEPDHRDEDAERRFELAREMIVALRRFRSGHAISPGAQMPIRVGVTGAAREVVEELGGELRRVGRLSEMDVADPPLDPAGSARIAVSGVEILVPLAGVLDLDAECARLRARLDGLGADAAKRRAKLENAGFVSKAPREVVDGERRKLETLEHEQASLREQLDELGCDGG